MNYKFRDFVGVFLINGDKNSVLALDMLHLEFINRVGVLIETEKFSIVDNEYIKYLEKKYNMRILKINSKKSSIENKGISEVKTLLKDSLITRYKIILASNNTNSSNIEQDEVILNPLTDLSKEDILDECTKRDLKSIDTYENCFI